MASREEGCMVIKMILYTIPKGDLRVHCHSSSISLPLSVWPTAARCTPVPSVGGTPS